MKNSTIRKVIGLGALAIIGTIAIQSYWFIKTWDVKQAEFNEKVNIALHNVAGEFEKLGISLPQYDVIKQVTSNYFVVNIRSDINANNLDFFLRKEFDRVGLKDDYEYGIYDCSSEKMMYGNYVSFSPHIDTSAIEKTELPTYDKFEYYFGVRFPHRNNYIWGQMTTTLIFGLLLLTTILFFIYSMSVILRQKRLSELQKDFINNMTHEFKTPISTIKISSEFLLKNKEIIQNKKLYKYVEIIQEQNKRLNNQVEKVLHIAKFDKRRIELNKEEINIHELLETIFDSVKLKVKEQNGVFKSELKAKNPIIFADHLHFTNVIYSLLDNAIKYSPDKPEITISTEDIGNKIYLRIKDNGIGIKKEHQKLLFRKFYRVPTDDVHDVKGFGLGLYYSSRVCKAHGWKLLVESAPEKGTTVSIVIKKS